MTDQRIWKKAAFKKTFNLLEDITLKINKMDHICVAVKDLDKAREVWEPLLGKTKPDDAYIDEPEKIRVARYWVGDTGFELMESTTPDGEVAKFIEKNGEGIMLLSFNVDNTQKAVEELKQKTILLLVMSGHFGIVNSLLSIPEK